MKKLFSVVLLVSMLFMGGCTTNDNKDNKETKNTMTLNITVKDEVNKKELYNGEVRVEGKVETLADFLEKADELEVVMEDGQYGKTIMGIKGVKTEDFQKGPWWLYESSNNESCVAAGQCDAASTLKIKDGDQFTFTYTASF